MQYRSHKDLCIELRLSCNTGAAVSNTTNTDATIAACTTLT